ncbi:MAG TPA: BTAD domain-containing putative transcriptional regulator [Egibacteraceae bacterium]|nr:BTAD domain-containing putative transcriptional regulator [Egibacteraceae bacterium]
MLSIHLIGTPRIVVDGEERRLRGRKAWALLARVALSDRPLSRRLLAAEVFPDAEDPLGALRWSLAELRRTLVAPQSLHGDPVQLNLPDDAAVDALALTASPSAVDLTGVGGRLLEGADAAVSAEYDSWLLVEQQRVAARVHAAIREASLRALAVGDVQRAVALAQRAAAGDPLDEGAQVLLVRALIASGDHDAAQRHVAACETLFASELGAAPSAALRSAARSRPDAPPMGVNPRAAAVSQLSAGKAALDAGAADAGIECLRRAVAEAESTGDTALQGEALLALGTALVHAVRGFDDEGAVTLHQAAAMARASGDQRTCAEALKELGYVDALAGRRPQAQALLVEAAELAADDDAMLAGVLAVQGLNLSDWHQLDEASRRFAESIELSRRAQKPRQTAWSLGVLGRTELLRGELGDARAVLDECLSLVEQEHWTAFRPWPSAFLGDVELAEKQDPKEIGSRMEVQFALSCQLADPCWEGVTGRVVGLSLAAAGHSDQALEWLSEARRRSFRATDRFAWVCGYILLAEAGAAERSGDADHAAAAALTLRDLSVRADLPGLLQPAQELTARLGV